MNFSDLESPIQHSITNNHQKVVFVRPAKPLSNVPEKLSTGIRGNKLFTMGSCMGRLVVDDETQEVYHTFAHGLKVFSLQEAKTELEKLKNKYEEFKTFVEKFQETNNEANNQQ